MFHFGSSFVEEKQGTGVMTMSCHRLVRTAVAVGRAGQPGKWVHQENLSRSQIRESPSHFPPGGGWWQGPALPSVQRTARGALHPQPPTAHPCQDQLLLRGSSPGRVISFMPPGMDSPPGPWPDAAAWQENALFPLLLPGKGGASSQGGFTSPGKSRQVQQEPRMLGHPSAVDGDGSCRTNP